MVTALMKGNRAVTARLKAHRPIDFGLPSIVVHDLCYGAYRSAMPAENLARIERLRFGVVGFDREDARVAGDIRAGLALAGEPIGAYDVLIAGQALARGLTVITRNMREFLRVPRLRVENWQG